MPYVITEACIDVNDRSCIDVCPVDCILEADRMQVIDPDQCIDCGACEPACPVQAIYAEPDVPEPMVEFVAINRAITDGPDQAREAVAGYLGKNELSPIDGYRPA